MSDTSGDPPIEGGIAADRVERLTKTIRDQSFPNLKPRDSATLILIDRSESVPKVLLGRRHERHRFMPGKFVFPGGRIEPQDASAEAAALREAFEEVGLPPDKVEPVGRLDDYETRTGFLVYPIVGIVTPPFPVKPDPFEVADVFEVPLDFILDRRNHRRESRLFKGRQRQFYVLPYDKHYIWGATASMLVNLCDVLVG